MILICDDDKAVRSSLELVLKRAGYDVVHASTPEEAIDIVRADNIQLILMDMNYTSRTDGLEGLTLLKQVKIFKPDVPVILITAWGSINLAVKGIQAGAFDFITKPWNNLALLKSVSTALELNEKDDIHHSKASKDCLSTRIISDKIIGNSPLLKDLFTTIERIAKTNAPVLITGESGTGKELIAEAIHENSNRNKEAFVKVNLGGISQSLFESEMFGHKKGAFTDAQYDRIGRFELADKGSIFLDELGELDSVCQVKLLRVLQDQTFERLGESKQKQVDVRIISATNRNLAEMVVDGSFREDLFYRVNLITIHLPALRERIEDIPLLVDHFMRKQVLLNHLPNIEVSAEAIQFLKSLPYPGNIRELKNIVDRTVLINNKKVLTDIDFKSQYIELPNVISDRVGANSLEDMERQMIIKTMRKYGGNLTKVAVALGLTRQALYRRIEKYNLDTNN
ncbi:sigma-54 dependent transcriptional regulator [Dysgonomonas sp. Marseille-P4361]|uniref:sigma-54-dependent transcriptional regulator n=1 Tax=Dysgonomonas sp. Marseille-P4361 TaxID=2161820 RepID=UPI000D55795B|nr:sigma-54 dependent transcriptional regulator [Dysgonomonas sp. Marseille-P4361]